MTIFHNLMNICHGRKMGYSSVVLLVAMSFCCNSNEAGPPSGVRANSNRTATPPSPSPSLAPMAKGCSETWQSQVSPLLNELTSEIKLRSLKKGSEEGYSVQFRIWVGFGNKSLRGFVFEQKGESRSATYYLERGKADARELHGRSLVEPRSGWSVFVKQVVPEKMLELRDECDFENEKTEIHPEDSEMVFIEIRKGPSYNAVLYQDPGNSTISESDRILEICRIVEREFNIFLISQEIE